MCTVLLPPGAKPIAVNEYININIKDIRSRCRAYCDQDAPSFSRMSATNYDADRHRNYLYLHAILTATVIF